MKHALIINAHQKHDKLADGRLTKVYIETAKKFLTSSGYEVKTTNIEQGYYIDEEIEKFQWAYYYVFQFPVFWMGVPWLAKKYIDEVFSQGKGIATFQNDGRIPKDPNSKYGTGGLMKGKRYMLSLTCNCPESEFNNPAGFFKGASIDNAHVGLHKIFQFCGASQLETFASFDVYRGDLDISDQKEKYLKVLSRNFL